MDLEKLNDVAYDAQYKRLLKEVVEKSGQLCAIYDDLIFDCLSVDSALGHCLIRGREIIFELDSHFKKSLESETYLELSKLAELLETIVDTKEEFEKISIILETDVSKRLKTFNTSSHYAPDLLEIYQKKYSLRKVLNDFFWTMWSISLELQESIENLKKHALSHQQSETEDEDSEK